MPPFRTLPTEASGGDGGLGLLARFEQGLDQQELMCRGLEELADSLPGRLDTLQAVLLVGRLRALLRRAHLLEETLVFPTLLVLRGDLGPVVARLRAEHAEDEDHAGDLEEALAGLAPTGRDAERVGYMTRCLFVGLRRHVAFERDHIRPLLGGGS